MNISKINQTNFNGNLIFCNGWGYRLISKDPENYDIVNRMNTKIDAKDILTIHQEDNDIMIEYKGDDKFSDISLPYYTLPYQKIYTRKDLEKFDKAEKRTRNDELTYFNMVINAYNAALHSDCDIVVPPFEGVKHY